MSGAGVALDDSKNPAMGVTGRAVRGFAARYGRPPEAVWSAPGRVNLIGEHTDYNDGFVLPFAIAERTVAAVGRRDGDTIRVSSASYPAEVTAPGVGQIGPGWAGQARPGDQASWAAYPLGVIWAVGQARSLDGLPGLDLFIDSEVPVGGGLSSSAALEMAVAGALGALCGLDLSTAELARAGQRAENEFVGAPTGVMDQYASLLGDTDAAVFLDCRTLRARPVPLRLARPGSAFALVLTDTGERHAHAGGGYAARRASCEKAARQLGVRALRDVAVADLPRAERELDDETFRRVRHIVTEDARVEATVAALEAGALDAVGRYLTASHYSMRDDYEITTPALDLAVDIALSAGALGARMTGGGFGGSTITLIDAERVPALTAALTSGFTAGRFPPPRVSTVTPGPGAHRETQNR
ncbi:MAG TPA: galactokinase [Trebonia sp.]